MLLCLLPCCAVLQDEERGATGYDGVRQANQMYVVAKIHTCMQGDVEGFRSSWSVEISPSEYEHSNSRVHRGYAFLGDPVATQASERTCRGQQLTVLGAVAIVGPPVSVSVSTSPHSNTPKPTRAHQSSLLARTVISRSSTSSITSVHRPLERDQPSAELCLLLLLVALLHVAGMMFASCWWLELVPHRPHTCPWT